MRAETHIAMVVTPGALLLGAAPATAGLPLPGHVAPAALAVVSVPVVPWLLSATLFAALALGYHRLRAARQDGERDRRARRALERRVEALAALHDLSNLLALHDNRKSLLDLVCRRLEVIFNGQMVAVLLRSDPEADGMAVGHGAVRKDDGAGVHPADGSEGWLETAACQGIAAAEVAGMRIAVGESLVGSVVRYGKGAVVPSRRLSAPGHRAESPLKAVPFLLLAPIRARSRVLGVLVVGGGRELAHQEQLAALVLFAESLGWSLERTRQIAALGERVMRLEQSNRELVDVNRKSDLFLATATHELRTPLSGIISYAEVLADYYETMSDAERRPLCIELNEQCKAMMGLVDGLFDFARLESGRLTLDTEATEIGELVGSAIDILEPTANERGIRIERRIDVRQEIEIDPTKIRQCVLNLVANAIKFTDPGGIVTVALARAELGVEVTISDTGRGIEPEDLDRVFDLYRSTAGPKARGVRGLGLGLYLVKNFVELHQGRIDVSSVSGEGSTFRFTIPCVLRPRHRDDTFRAA
ncbi:MAG: HAMP domain-containing sensor histidine kinase [Candidatus Eiseniibacteriota bacterium]|jgi:signal transduction histidine kinase